MALNYIWVFFFLCAFVVAVCKAAFWGDWPIFNKLVEGMSSGIETGVTISLGYIGIMTFWLGIMKVGEAAGAVAFLAKLVGPFFSRLFPGVPKDHPANGAIIMNYSANMLGLDSAATPLGLKAMSELQELNPEKDTASDAQIMFLVLNTSGLTLLPIGVFALRQGTGAENITGVFIPILIATFVATLAGMIAVALKQRIKLFDKVVMAYLGGALALIGGLVFLFAKVLPYEQVEPVATAMANVLIMTIIVSFIALSVFRKVNVYENFIEGAKGGFEVAIRIIPYLVAILCAISVFRASGALDSAMDGVRHVVGKTGVDVQWVEGIPTAMMKPLSGSGAKGMAGEAMVTHGPDSFIGNMVSVMQGSADTTFFILAVYFGSVGIRKTRYALTCGLIADAAGLTAAVFLSYLFFG
jgi:spore maturation protein SpmA